MLEIAAGIVLGFVTLAASGLALSAVIGFFETVGARIEAARSRDDEFAHAEPHHA